MVRGNICGAGISPKFSEVKKRSVFVKEMACDSKNALAPMSGYLMSSCS